MGKLRVGIGVLALSVLIIGSVGTPAGESLGRLAFGWVSYLVRVVPKVTISGDGVFTGVFCLILFTVGLHLFLRWFHREIQTTAGSPNHGSRRWSPRWTASLVSIVVLMFVTGISAAVVMHQVGWLLASRRSLLTYRAAVGESSTSNLQMIGLASSGYLSHHPALPVANTDAQGRMLHSWQTAILLDLPIKNAGDIQTEVPWDDPRNSAYFRGIVSFYLNPEIGVVRNLQGYALSHYAGNVNVLGAGRTSRLDTIKGTLSNTILAGEVSGQFKPWGDPTNLRDPGLGVNSVPNGFGGPSGKGVNFLFLDGSVRFVRNTTDPAVLRRMSLAPESSDPR